MPISLCAALNDGFSQLLPVMMWIFIIVICLSVALTVILHYRKRKSISKLEKEDIKQEIENTAGSFCYKTNDGKFVYVDHTGLLKELKKKLSYSHAKFAALQQDFTKLKSGLPDPASSYTTDFITNKKNSMENVENNVMPGLQQDGVFIPATNTIDKVDFSNPPNEPNLYRSAEAGNISLQEEYHKDLLEEKKKQIDFLQGQVDLRVKKFYESEQERIANKKELDQVKSELAAMAGEAEILKNETNKKQEDLEAILTQVNENETVLIETRQALQDKQAQIIYIQNVLQELRQQNELLNAATADNEERNKFLQLQLEAEETKTKIMEQKLRRNKQLLQRLYNEFAICMNEESEESPVIALRPDYATVTGDLEEAASV